MKVPSFSLSDERLERNETPVLEEESFDRLQEVMTLACELENPAPYEKIVNNTYAYKSIEN